MVRIKTVLIGLPLVILATALSNIQGSQPIF
jgi:hypothetical protein